MKYSLSPKLITKQSVLTVFLLTVVFKLFSNPVATNDTSLNNTPVNGASLTILINDTLHDGSIATAALTTVFLDATSITGAVQTNDTTVTVPNQGVWLYDGTTGILTFTPDPGFHQSPDVLSYILTENSTALKDTANVLVTFLQAVPFTCSDRVFYEVQLNQLYSVDILNNDFDSIGQPAIGNINGIGYNVNDSFIYGFGKSGDIQKWLIKLDTNGVYEKITYLGFGSAAGDVDTTDHLWMLDINTYLIRRIDLAAPYTVSEYTTTFTSSSAGPADIVYLPSNGQDVFYGLKKISTDSAMLYRFVITGTSTYDVTVKTISGFIDGGTDALFGAGWTDKYGDLYFGHNQTGYIYRIHDFNTSAPWPEHIFTVTSTTMNDGASCRNSYPPFITADIGVLKSVNDSTPDIGDTITFTLTVTNNGPDNATGVYVLDTLPSGYTYISDNGGGSFDPATNKWDIGSLTVGATTVLNINARVNSSGDTLNIALTKSGVYDPVDDNNSDTSHVTPLTFADLVTVKTLSSGDSTPNEGDVVSFNIMVTNKGPGQSTNTTLTDLIPSSLTATANNGLADQGSYSSVTGIWTIGTLAVGDSVNLHLEGTVNAGEAGDTITNITTKAHGDLTDTTDVGNDLSEHVKVNKPPVAVNDSSLNNQLHQVVTLPILNNDTLGDGSAATNNLVTIVLDETSVPGGILNPDGSVTVPGEGVWVYDSVAAEISFTPEYSFVHDPTPITYTLTEVSTGLSDTAKVVITVVKFGCQFWISCHEEKCLTTVPLLDTVMAGVFTGTGSCPGNNSGTWSNPQYPGAAPVTFNSPNSDTTTFLVDTPGIYTLRYTWPDGTYVQTSHYFYEPTKPIISGDTAVNTCTNETYVVSDGRSNTFGDVSYNWYVLSGGTIVGSDSSETVTVHWDNLTGSDTLVVNAHICAPCQCLASCAGWDTIVVTKTAPKFAGQVKYWNQYETYMPSPFATEQYYTTPFDYFYVTLYHVNGTQYDSLETAYVQPRLMENLEELMSYFEFDINTNTFGCDAQYVLKVWDGGLCYHNNPPPPQEETNLGGSYTYRNWGGVNATDALAIQLMAAHKDIHGAPWNYNWVGPLSDVPNYGYYSHGIADVNSSNTYANGGITALDALTAKYRSVGLIGNYPHNGSGNNQFSPNFRVTGRLIDSLPEITFPKPFDYDTATDIPFTHSGTDYLYFTKATAHKYTSAPISMDNSKDYINIYYESIGDVNAGYIPPGSGLKALPTAILVYENNLKASLGDEITIPVKIDRQAKVGAITLSMSYRNDLIEVLETGFGEDGEFIDQKTGLLNMAWYSMNAVDYKEGDIIATIKVKIIGSIPENTKLFKLKSGTELADADAHAFEVGLKTVTVTTRRFVSGDAELQVTNYPNPFDIKTTFKYVLPENGKVKLEIYDLRGKHITTLVDKEEEAGTHVVEFVRTAALQDGIYVYHLSLVGEDNSYAVVKKFNVTLNPYNLR